jgi:hypothetical protein
MFSVACQDPVTMEPSACGTAARPPSEYVYCIPTYDNNQSPYHAVCYVAYPRHCYQPEDMADLTALSPTSEYWHFGTRMCHNSELLPNLEVVSIFFYTVTVLN